jgi:hypothetical protein
MNAVTRYAVHVAQAKTGLSGTVIAGYVAQGALALVTAVLLLVAVFFVFADYLGFGSTKTSIGMFVFFAMLLVGTIFWTSHIKAQIKEQAQRALHRPAQSLPLSPPLLKAGVDLGKMVGFRRMVPGVVMLIIGTGLVAEWTRHKRAAPPGDQ